MTLVAPRFQARRTPWPRPATLLTGAGVALLPWMVVLAKTLPQTAEVANWSTAWIGLDALLAAGLSGTGLLLRRHDPRAAPLAAATAALLLMDAWFDVTTSAPGGARATALALAVCAELPLAAVCAAVATRRPVL
ncbi:LPXTG cell wall anchor domain-containing protein [Streptomyces sp. NPDC090741]|uniref:LPXTG cell wall anchor domain-containing protein n=1 Tax=Streptomyces sp. NPDC090741 TaxID=3365967 RepID=UPI00381C7AF0